jgi:hypothetical protein
MQINVQFSDDTETTVVSYFAGPQNAVEWANLGVVDTSDARYKSFYDSMPSAAQQGMPSPS